MQGFDATYVLQRTESLDYISNVFGPDVKASHIKASYDGTVYTITSFAEGRVYAKAYDSSRGDPVKVRLRNGKRSFLIKGDKMDRDYIFGDDELTVIHIAHSSKHPLIFKYKKQ